MRKNKFGQLKPDEEILMEVHQDWVPYIPRLVVFAIWFVIPWFFLFPLFRRGWIGVAAFFVVVLLALFFWLRSWYAWQKTMFVVTNRRMVDIDQHGYFSRTVSEMFFSNIDDVSYRKKGVLQMIFGYGTVRLETSGSAADIEVSRVRQPSRLHDLINDLRGAEIEGEPKDPKERKLKKIASNLSEDEIAEVAQETRKRFRKRAVKEFFEE